MRKGIVAVACAALVAAAAGCGSNDGAGGSSAAAGDAKADSGSAASGGTVRIVSPGFSAVADAPYLKFVDALEAKGVDVEMSTIDDPAQALRVVVSGRADMVIGDPVETALAVSHGGVHIKYLVTSEQATDYLIVSQPGISIDNLAGKSFGIASPGTSGQTIGNAAFQKAGIDPKSLHAVTIGDTGARVTALLAGKVDVVPVHADAAIPAIDTGKAKLLLKAGKVLGPYLQQGLIANDDFVAKNKALVQTTVDTLIDSFREFIGNEDAFRQQVQAGNLQGDLTDAQVGEVYKQLEESKFYAKNGGICDDFITRLVNFNYESGTLQKDKAVPQSEWVDPSFVQHYLAAHDQPKDTC